jgi:hypothetical protein
MSSQLFTAVAITFLGAACAGRAERVGDDVPAVPDSVIVEAFNDHFYEARIHAVYAGGQRRSLGTIAGNGGHTKMAIAWQPRALSFEVAFIIDGAEYVSHTVDVSPGELVEVRLPPNINESGFFRRVQRK